MSIKKYDPNTSCEFCGKPMTRELIADLKSVDENIWPANFEFEDLDLKPMKFQTKKEFLTKIRELGVSVGGVG